MEQFIILAGFLAIFRGACLLKKQVSLHTAVLVAADLLGILSLIGLISPLSERFSTISNYNAIILIAAFLMFCTAVYLIKRLEPLPNAVHLLPRWLTAVTTLRIFGLLFGVVLAIFLAHQFGYLNTISLVGSFGLNAGEASSLFVYGPGAWLGLGLIYVLVLSSTAVPRFHTQSNSYHRMTFFGLLGVNLMINVIAAETNALLNRSGIAWDLVKLLMFGLLFLPPRLTYVAKVNQVWHLFSFIILLIVAAFIPAA
jgi:hypothetical protein